MKNPPHTHTPPQGFTLLELSIVLVIIGLVIGGVVAGKHLIEAAQLQKSVSVLREVNVAANTFKLKYNGLPGDFTNAQDYNLHLDETGATTACTLSGFFYNGNDDNILGGYLLTSYPRYSGEYFNFFAHMNNAAIWQNTIVRKDTLNADCLQTGSPMLAGTHYPAIPLGDGFIVITDSSTRKHYFVLGGMGAARLNDRIAHANSVQQFYDELTAQQANQIDMKIDDGKALSGLAKACSTANCYRDDTADTGSGYVTFDDADGATNCVYNGNYNLEYETPACTLLVELGRF